MGRNYFLKDLIWCFLRKNESVSDTVIFSCIFCYCSTLILLMYLFFIRKYLVGLWGTLQYCLSNSLKSLCRDSPFSSALKNLKTFSFSFLMKIGKIMPNTKVFLVMSCVGNFTGYVSRTNSQALAHSSVSISVENSVNISLCIFPSV